MSDRDEHVQEGAELHAEMRRRMANAQAHPEQSIPDEEVERRFREKERALGLPDDDE